jgi:signal transduction histidine kinase/CheY-like chemotaxis protein
MNWKITFAIEELSGALLELDKALNAGGRARVDIFLNLPPKKEPQKEDPLAGEKLHDGEELADTLIPQKECNSVDLPCKGTEKGLDNSAAFSPGSNPQSASDSTPKSLSVSNPGAVHNPGTNSGSALSSNLDSIPGSILSFNPSGNNTLSNVSRGGVVSTLSKKEGVINNTVKTEEANLDQKNGENEEATDDIFAKFVFTTGFLNLLGLSPAFLPENPIDFINDNFHPGDGDKLFVLMDKILKGYIGSFNMEHLLWNSRIETWQRCFSSGSVEKVDGDPLHLHITFILGVLNATDTFEAELNSNDALTWRKPNNGEGQALLSKAEHYQIMLDTLPVVCSIWDTEYKQIDCNDAVVPLFRVPDKKTFLDYFPILSPPYQPDGQESDAATLKYIKEAFKNGYAHFQWLFQTIDGDPIQSDVTLVKVTRDSIEILISYIKDLRELKATEAVLERERALLQKILDNSPISFLISVDGSIKFLTPFARKTMGVNIGDPVEKIFAIDEEAKYVKRMIDKKGKLIWHEVEIFERGGRTLHMLLNGFKTDYGGAIGHMFWLMDVTEMAEKEKALNIARDEAEASTRAKSEFLANMSHEIRTPMNAIIGLCHLTMQTELSEQQLEYVSRTQSAAKALLRIINDILDFSKIEAGKLEMEKVEFQLQDVLTEAIELQSMRAVEKDLEIYLDMPELQVPTLIGDPVRLSQVLNNLLSNAIKFTNKGEVGIKVELLEEIPKSITVRFTVRDSGIGLTPEQIGRLFTPFSQADSSTTRKYGGTGLGLTITKRLVEMMNGIIFCDSIPNKGSTFTFTARFELLDKWIKTDIKPPFHGLSAMAIDNNPSSLQVLSTNLVALGFQVIRFLSGEAALSRFQALKQKKDAIYPDLIMMDWDMPGLNGPESLEHIFQELPLLPQRPDSILMVSGPITNNQQEIAEKLGVKLILSKPYSIQNLNNTLQELFTQEETNTVKKKVHQSDYSDLVTHLKGAKILLVEDNEVNQLVASRILKKAGFIVTIANNGQEAIEKVQADNFRLVLMDIQMPVMDGIEATQAIRNIPGYQKLPIVAMTAHAMSGDKELSLKSGMNDHVNKPIDVQELFKTIAKWIDPQTVQQHAEVG